MPKALTVKAIENLEAPPNRREIPDGTIRGLYLIHQPSGAMSWALRYRQAGQPRKLTLGTSPGLGLADARKAAHGALAVIAQGGDPATKKRETRVAAIEARIVQTKDDVGRVVELFVERYAKRQTRDWQETERLLKKDIVKPWAGRRLSTITPADVRERLNEITDRGAAFGANRVFAHFRKMCSWAKDEGIVTANVCDNVKKVTREGRDRARSRVLDDRELSLVWRAANSLGFPFGPMIHLLILTGARRDEIAAMPWNEIDLEKKIWTLPAARSKNRREHAVHLSATALGVIEALPRFSSPFLFSARNTAPSGFSAVKRRLDARVAALNGGEAIEPFVLHDIRRTVASGMASIGINLPVIERVLNHVSGSFGGIVGVYQRHGFETEKRAALDAWARHVEATVEGATSANVVKFASVRG